MQVAGARQHLVKQASKASKMSSKLVYTGARARHEPLQVAGARQHRVGLCQDQSGTQFQFTTQFTCFTSTKVQRLTLEAPGRAAAVRALQFTTQCTCFTDT